MTTSSEILPPTELQTVPANPVAQPARKPRGKIAELPEALRNELNQMLDDGVTYQRVADHMNATHQLDLNTTNIGNWYDDGFQQYLQHKDWLIEMRNVREGASDFFQSEDTLKIHQAANQLSALQIFRTLKSETLKDDHINRIRNMNALSRLSREALVFKKYENALAKEQPDLSSKAGGTDAPSKEELDRQLLDKSDDFFGLKSPARLQAEWQAAASTHSSSSHNDKDERNKIPQPRDRVPMSSGVGNPGKDEERPNLGHVAPNLPVAPEISPQNAVGNSSLDLNSSLEISPSSSPGSPIETQKSAFENPVPSPGGEGQGEGEHSGPQLENSPVAAEVTRRTPSDLRTENCTLNTENSRSPASAVENLPQIENRKLAFENSPHPDLLTCHCCRAELPPLLQDGQRPSPFCPKCRTALRHPATLKFYCPSCSGNLRNIWDDDRRTSDNCPLCHAHLPPPPIWPPLSPPPQSPETPAQLAHVE